MASPTYKPVPQDHKEYDEHLTCAFKKALPWYKCPVLGSTELRREDFWEDARVKITALLPKVLPKVDRDCLSPRNKYMQHIAYTVVRMSMPAHFSNRTPDEVMQQIHKDICRTARDGVFLVDETHPLWRKEGQKTIGHTSSGMDINMIEVNKRDQTLAQNLVGRKFTKYDDLKLEGPIVDIVRETCSPHLLELSNETRFIRYHHILRMKLRSLLEKNSDQSFNQSVRHTCTEMIADAWDEGTTNAVKQKTFDLTEKEGIDIFQNDVCEVLNTYIGPIQSKEDFCSRRAVLEQLSIAYSLEDEMVPEDLDAFYSDEQNKKIETASFLIDLWHRYFRGLDIAPCDYPMSGLALLALSARRATREQFLTLL